MKQVVTFQCTTLHCNISKTQCGYNRSNVPVCKNCDWEKMQKNSPKKNGNGKGYKKGVFCRECGGRVGIRCPEDLCTKCQKEQISNGRGYKKGVKCAQCGGRVGIRCSGDLCTTCQKEKDRPNPQGRYCAECGGELNPRTKSELCPVCREKQQPKKVKGTRNGVRCKKCGGYIACRTEGDICSNCRKLGQLGIHQIRKGIFPPELHRLDYAQVMTVLKNANMTFTIHENNSKAIEELQELALATTRFLSPPANHGKHEVRGEFLQELANGMIVVCKLLDKHNMWDDFAMMMHSEVVRLESRIDQRLDSCSC